MNSVISLTDARGNQNIYSDAAVSLAPTGCGVLDGLTFAAKDVFDVAGRVASAGCPAFAAIHSPAPTTAPVIQRLRAAGARLVGMTVTEELMFGVLGQGVDAPRNPVAPDRLVGGSSSGSAAAVAGGHCDFALGTDTGGSVRVPASFCGLYGLRPSYGSVSIEGVVPLAPRFDTVGWLARTPERLAAIGRVLLPECAAAPQPKAIWMPPETTEGLDPTLVAEITLLAEALAENLKVPLETQPIGLGPADWGMAWKALQGRACWETHGAWIKTCLPPLGSVASRRFAAARAVSATEIVAGEKIVGKLQRSVLPRLRTGWLLVMPTTPCPAPRRSAPEAVLEAARSTILSRTALAGLLGLPELSAPLISQDDLPVGLSLIGPSGADVALLELATQTALHFSPPLKK